MKRPVYVQKGKPVEVKMLTGAHALLSSADPRSRLPDALPEGACPGKSAAESGWEELGKPLAKGQTVACHHTPPPPPPSVCSSGKTLSDAVCWKQKEGPRGRKTESVPVIGTLRDIHPLGGGAQGDVGGQGLLGSSAGVHFGGRRSPVHPRTRLSRGEIPALLLTVEGKGF